jgi:hypothetical protein
MPKAMEENLKKEAMKKFGSTKSEHARKYIWGTMRKTGKIKAKCLQPIK